MSNDNTTNNFEELTFPSLLNKYDKILIPMIQRDYAQGRNDKKAQEVRTNLLNDIFEKDNVHFDLIFGSCEWRNENDGGKNYFIPVDGQQRLTTLFLLYLYAQKIIKSLKNDLSKFSYDTRRAAADFCKEVTTKHWIVKPNEKVSDVIRNSVWFMNYWENDPTVAGMLNMLDAIHEKANAERRTFPNLDNVKFYFFDLKSSGLNENLYLKMNSRGKPLTAFEKLKASIEKKLQDNSDSDGTNNYFPENGPTLKTFKDKWKFFMDREWVNAFWNREKPEDTDISITAFIVRFLSGYYNSFYESNEENDVSEKLKDINNRNSYADFIPFEPINKSLELKHAFQRLATALTTIVNKDSIKPQWVETIKTTDLHEYKIIAVVFAYVLFEGNSQAMRVAWNLAENTVSSYDTYIAYCKRIGEIFSYHSINNQDNIYQILASNEFKNPSAQLTEEIAKAKKINEDSSWEPKIIEAEKYAFFKGSIRFLFQNSEGRPDWENFDTKWKIAQVYFDNNGVKKEFKTILTKMLVIQCNNWENQIKDKQIFNTSSNTWKWILCSTIWTHPIHHILLQSKIRKTETLSESNANDYILPILDKLPYEEFVNKEPNGRFRWNYRLGYYKPYGHSAILFDWEDFQRNALLNELLDEKVIEIKSGKIIRSDSAIRFFSGWNINFKYRYKNFQWNFQWNYNNFLYLMDNNWNRMVDDSKSDSDYCFNALKCDAQSIKNQMNALIDKLGGKTI